MARNDHLFYQQLGARLKLQRGLCGMSQTTAGEKIGVSFQQMQKYESGANRIPIEKLMTLCAIYECTIEQVLQITESEAAPSPAFTRSDQNLRAIMLFDKLSGGTKFAIMHLLRALAKEESKPTMEIKHA